MHPWSVARRQNPISGIRSTVRTGNEGNDVNRRDVAAGRSQKGTGPPAGRDRDLLADLRTSIDKVLGPLLPAGTRCALMDFPNSANVGDAAIWMGERAWLERSGIDVVYTCDRFTYSPSRLRRELKDGVILWHGGGNLGDLWPAFQAFRERVVAGFPDNRIIQLPQSIWFGEPANAARASKIFNDHPNLHLLLCCSATKRAWPAPKSCSRPRASSAPIRPSPSIRRRGRSHPCATSCGSPEPTSNRRVHGDGRLLRSSHSTG
jgi:hypothetical protein